MSKVKLESQKPEERQEVLEAHADLVGQIKAHYKTRLKQRSKNDLIDIICELSVQVTALTEKLNRLSAAEEVDNVEDSGEEK